MQRNDSRGSQYRLAQPAHAEQEQQDADDELQQVQRNPIKERPQCKHQGYKERDAGQGAPITAGRPPRTEATARTIVRASTASTSELRNAVAMAGAAAVQVIYQCFLVRRSPCIGTPAQKPKPSILSARKPLERY